MNLDSVSWRANGRAFDVKPGAVIVVSNDEGDEIIGTGPIGISCDEEGVGCIGTETEESVKDAIDEDGMLRCGEDEPLR